MSNKVESRINEIIKKIDTKTDELLEIADVLEEYEVNVKLENGKYLNPVSVIRSKIDVIWDYVQEIRVLIKHCEEDEE